MGTSAFCGTKRSGFFFLRVECLVGFGLDGVLFAVFALIVTEILLPLVHDAVEVFDGLDASGVVKNSSVTCEL